MSLIYLSTYEDPDFDVDTDMHATHKDAQRVALDSVRRWMENWDIDDVADLVGDLPVATAGVIIETTRYTVGEDSDAPLTHTVDPLPQIREAFPEVARRLDALDELERRMRLLDMSPDDRENLSALRSDALAIIREAKR